MKKKIFALILALVLTLPFAASCTVKVSVPAGSLELKVDAGTGKKVVAVGAECDPHFLSGNVGRTMISESTGQPVTMKEEDWDNVFAPRIADMGIGYLRVMLLTSWYAEDEESYRTGQYHYDSLQMRSLYQVLDTAQKNGIEVNLVVWLWDSDYYKVSPENDWSLPTKGEGERVFAEVFADCVKYLIEEKGYTCIQYVTPVNEPSSTYKLTFGATKGFEYYASQMRVMHEVFTEKGIRDKVKFNLSDDAANSTWLEMTLEQLEGVYDLVNSHTYDFGPEHSNADITDDNQFFNFRKYASAADAYGVPHIFGEFGTFNGGPVSNWRDASRGLQIARLALNMFQAGSCGFSYWMLFGMYYDWEADDEFGNNMGLWGCIDEDYNCRPVYYAYSLLTRFARKGMEIYLCPTVDENIVAVALRSGNDWTYLVVNDSVSESKTVTFANYGKKYPKTLARYVYDQNDVPTDNKVIASSGKVDASGRTVTATVAPLTFTVFTTL